MVDNDEILEKAVAVKAGLGWFGRNTLLVTADYGSLVFLGELITNIPFPPDNPTEGDCGNCRKCIEACPTKALEEGKKLNPDLCLSSLTQSKSSFDHEIRKNLGDNIYGCDICQMVCPYNKRTNQPLHPEFSYGYDDAFPLLSEIISLSGAGFRKRFGHTSGAWRGRTPLQRNAIIAAGNARAAGFVPVLGRVLFNDPRPVIRSAAAWALGEISTPDVVQILNSAVQNEKDLEVLEEIRGSLEKVVSGE